jgi:hypothetical protein
VKFGNNTRATCTILFEAYGGEDMKMSSVSEWNKWFKEYCKNMEDNERSGHPRSQKTDENVK